jgi:DNA-binding FadR family transcriptional regulator
MSVRLPPPGGISTCTLVPMAANQARPRTIRAATTSAAAPTTPRSTPEESDSSDDDFFSAPRRLKRSERLARQIASGLLADRTAPGTSLPDEKQMADQYGVARSTLRESLRLLETWGVLTVKTGRTGGPLVTMPSPADLGLHVGVVMQAANATLGDVLDAREVMDSLMARRAAIFITDAQLEALAVSLRSMQRALDRPAAFETHTKTYYEILLAASRNPALAVLSGSLRTIATRVLGSMRYSNEWRGESLTLRRAVLRALAAGDPDEAEKRTMDFRSASRRYIASLDPTIFERPIDILKLDLDDDASA